MTLNKEKIEDRIYTEMLDLCLMSTAYYLLDKLGMNATKTVLTLSHISEIAQSVRQGNVSLDELREGLAEEYGIKITRKYNGVSVESRRTQDDNH